MPDNVIIKTKDLKKTFRSKVKGKWEEVEAVKGVDLEVKQGEIFGFLGPNGAGKSTVQKMLATLLDPTSGEATIAGFDLAKDQDKIRQTIGYVSQAGGADWATSGFDNLLLQAQLYGIDFETAKKNAKEYIDRFQLTTFADRIADSYSGGQRRRLDIALGMIHHPKILLLDEPTIGLDPQSRAFMWEEIKKLREDGVTIFLTTHYMDEADKLCNNISIIDNGVIIEKGTPVELKASVGADTIKFGFSDADMAHKAENFLKGKENIQSIHFDENYIHLYVKDGERLMPDLLRLLDANNLKAQSVVLSKPSLDDVFLKYTGHSLREDKV